MSRQNPGFGASSAAHVLPYEVEIANDMKPYQNATSGGPNDSVFGVGGGAGGMSRRRASVASPPPRTAKDDLSA